MNTIIVLLIGSIILSVASITFAVYAFRVVWSTKKLREHMGPNDHPENLEDILNAIVSKIKGLEQGHEDTNNNLTNTANQASTAVKKLGLIRFNSFADEGGNLSFCLAMLDSDNNGVVLTSLHGRQQNRMYAKKVLGSVGEVALNDEEQQAVMLAVTEHKQQIQSKAS